MYASVVFRVFLFQIDHQVSVRHLRRIFERLLYEFHLTWIHLPDQMCYLRRVARIPEKHHVLCIKANGAAFFVFFFF